MKYTCTLYTRLTHARTRYPGTDSFLSHCFVMRTLENEILSCCCWWCCCWCSPVCVRVCPFRASVSYRVSVGIFSQLAIRSLSLSLSRVSLYNVYISESVHFGGFYVAVLFYFIFFSFIVDSVFMKRQSQHQHDV